MLKQLVVFVPFLQLEKPYEVENLYAAVAQLSYTEIRPKCAQRLKKDIVKYNVSVRQQLPNYLPHAIAVPFIVQNLIAVLLLLNIK